MRRVSVLGSTGSIGSQALDLVALHPDRFEIAGLAARNNVAALAAQANIFRPAVLSVGSEELLGELRARLTYEPEQLGWGNDGLVAVATGAGVQRVLAATDGMAALPAVLDALEHGVDVALCNKELVVAAGELLFATAAANGAKILPVDSEHSAVYQCLLGERRDDVASIVLTASGGPFWELTLEQMERVTPAQALAHPTWAMGPKNTLDSATLMNKGLEVIEAGRFFGMPGERIEIVVHRQSIAHAFVVMVDGSVKAQLAWPDMKVPIGYALAYPERLEGADTDKTRSAIGLGVSMASLAFEPVDRQRFPAIDLCYGALRTGGTFPAVLSAANEEAGRAFLQGKVKFTDICALVARTLEAHHGGVATLEAIQTADAWARHATLSDIASMKRIP